ncbi:MAG: hypothetical protein IJE91_00930 [Clostridia bacterium]|nr:hypothetical protein [Clostridia bacterium]
MDPIYYGYIAVGVALVGFVAMLTIKIVKNRKRKKQEEAIEKEKTEKNLEIIDDVRYTAETNPVEEQTGDVNVTHLQGDIVLNQNTPVTVDKNGQIKPGKYILISTDANTSSFNIRVGIYVREYKHNQEIVLAEGDTICSVSGSVILR